MKCNNKFFLKKKASDFEFFQDFIWSGMKSIYFSQGVYIEIQICNCRVVYFKLYKLLIRKKYLQIMKDP